MSEIIDRALEYHQGKIEWPVLLDWLIRYPYGGQRRYDDPATTAADEADHDYPHVDGSWDDVDRAVSYGLITAAQQGDVLRGRKALKDAKSP